jgi:hypothetical protein
MTGGGIYPVLEAGGLIAPDIAQARGAR